ncbi:hypothetical protein BJ322DRAFT_1114377 [Thelephora terrestris]|uniref:F-box domain-containing protein n=1 Tax=Thelephora terrestris TaxID=56493 RepID=A0A9P6H2K7_9AGAM|nr:hypothetical protein BJ322DRAFT_1114377 [Thelephora terrestris]
MSSRLPLEILDYIVDFLDDEPQALKDCCLVAKSRVPRARKHLFSEIKIVSLTALNAWWKVFPDSGISPGYRAHSLHLSSIDVISLVVVGGPGWIQPFFSVVRLKMRSVYETPGSYTSSQFFKLICSLPLLDDLDIEVYWTGNDDGPVFKLRASPPLTGSLSVSLVEGIEYFARGLPALPNGFHFRKVVCTWDFEEDLLWIMALMEGCYNTLEYVEMKRDRHSSSTLVDLSKATKFKEVAFGSTNLISPGSPTRSTL